MNCRKMKTKHNVVCVALASTMVLASCSESFLEPKSPSIYTPENTYINYEGLMSALTACNRNSNHEMFGDGAPIIHEMRASDIAICGQTDQSGPLCDYDTQLTPSNIRNDGTKDRTGWYWQENFYGIKYANIVLNRMGKATFASEAEEKEVRGMAYFHRDWRYLKNICQFGDVPWIDHEITTPEVSFNSNDRWSMLEQMELDMEYAYKWMQDGKDLGYPNKGAAGLVLMKILMLNGKFKRAIDVGNEIVTKHPLMTAPFSTAKAQHPNVMIDLFSTEGKISPANTEGLYYAVSWPQMEGREKSQIMRNAVPYWAKINTPDGKTGCQQGADNADVNTIYDNNNNVGRGIGTVRPTNYYQFDIWGKKELNDVRSRFNKDSWRYMEDLYYNKPGTNYYRQPLQKPTNLSAGDSIRWWFSWPWYRLFIPDEFPDSPSDLKGGDAPMYIMRSAEVYLLLAECYYWMNDPANAAEMLNIVRRRSGADDLTADEITIGSIVDERARELYYEEARHVELVRISYIFARTGKPCEVFGGHVYKLDDFSGPDVVGEYNKQHGYNFYFDWVDTHNNFYNKGVKTKYYTYTLSNHHVLWPIPENAITANTGGVINQNPGYIKIQPNIDPIKVSVEPIKE